MKSVRRDGCPNCGRPGTKIMYCKLCWDLHVKPKLVRAGIDEKDYLRSIAIQLNINSEGKYEPSSVRDSTSRTRVARLRM